MGLGQGLQAFRRGDDAQELDALGMAALNNGCLLYTSDQEGLFPEDGFRQEQRQLLEMLDSEYNDKMVYAHQRCEELLFQGQNAGLGRCGSRADVEALERRAVTAGWEELLQNAKIEIFALGDCVPDVEAFRARFAGLGKEQPTGLLS